MLARLHETSYNKQVPYCLATGANPRDAVPPKHIKNIALTITSTVGTESGFSQYTTLNDHCRVTNILSSTADVGQYICEHINLAHDLPGSDERYGTSHECPYCLHVQE